MDRKTELNLIERVLGNIAKQTFDMADHGGTAPVAQYLSPELFEAEKEKLLWRFPVALAHIDQLKLPGDYVLRDVAGRSVLIVHGKDGEIRAFLNACRHRAAELVTETCGHTQRLVCPYHAWTYTLDGSLTAIPGAEGFSEVNKADLGLLQYPSTVRYGMIWVVPSPGLMPDWKRWFAPVDAELSDLQLDKHVIYRSREVIVNANWKSVNDAFMEGYHFRVVHKDSVYPLYADNQGAFDAMGPHYRYFLAHKNFADMALVEPQERELRKHCLMVYQLFPATSIQVLPDHLFVHTLLPLGVNKCVARNTMFIREPVKDEKAEHYWNRNYDMVVNALDEDHGIAESTFRGLSSGINPDLIFGRFEQGIVHMHARATEALNGELILPLATKSAHATQ